MHDHNITIYSDNTRFSNFLTTSAEIAKYISYLFPDIKPSRNHQHSRKCHTSVLKGEYQKSEKGYIIIKKWGKDPTNNVDVTDNLRAFNKKEYFKLPQAYWTMLHMWLERQKFKRTKTSETSAITTTNNPQGLAVADIGALLNRAMQTLVAQENTMPPTNTQIPRFRGSYVVNNITRMQYHIRIHKHQPNIPYTFITMDWCTNTDPRSVLSIQEWDMSPYQIQYEEVLKDKTSILCQQSQIIM